MASYWGYGVPAAVLGALGTGEEQRRQALAKQELDSLNQYRKMQIAIQQLQLEESKRQHDLQYGEASYTDPVTGQTYKAPRSLLPAVLQMAGAREKELNPEEITALGNIRQRLESPTGTVKLGGIPWDPTLEAEATKKAFPEFAKEIGPLTVDQPQVALPRQSVEKVITEAAGVRKERETQERKDKQSLANAAYRQIYQLARSQGQPHELADLIAIQSAAQSYGVPPEREAFQAEPRPERNEPKMSLEDEFLKALQKPAAGRSPYEQSVISQYQQSRDKNETLVDLAKRAQRGDRSAQEAIDIYRRASEQDRKVAVAEAMGILSQARILYQTEKGKYGMWMPDPIKDEAEIARISRQFARGNGDPAVIAIVEAMVSPGGGPVTPQPMPTPGPPAPRPAAPAPRPPVAVPSGGRETLSRQDARYSAAKQRGLTDEQIQEKFNLRLVD